MTYTSDLAPNLIKEFVDIWANIECGFTLKCIRDMRLTYTQMNCRDKYSEIISIVWSV